MGLKIDDNNQCCVYFADDQLVIAEGHDDIKYMIRQLKESYNEAG